MYNLVMDILVFHMGKFEYLKAWKVADTSCMGLCLFPQAGRRRYRSTAGRRRYIVFCVRCSFLLTLMYYIETAVCRESM
jgi:hypothetical protein